MRKRSISILLIISMMVFLLTGCGQKDAPATVDSPKDDKAVEIMSKSDEEVEEKEDTGEQYSLPESMHGTPVVMVGDLAYFLGNQEIMSLNVATGESEVVWLAEPDYKDQYAFSYTNGIVLCDNLYFIRDYDDDRNGVSIPVRELSKLNLTSRELETVASFDEGCYCTTNMYYEDGILYTDCNYNNDCFRIDEKGNVTETINRSQLEEYAKAPENYSLTTFESGMKTLFPKETYSKNGKLILFNDEYNLVVYDPSSKRSTELGGQLIGLNDEQYIMSTYNDNNYTIGLINRQTGEYKFLTNMDEYLSSIGDDKDYMYYATSNKESGATEIGRLSLSDGKYSIIYTMPLDDSRLEVDTSMLSSIIKLDNYVFTVESHDCGLYPAAINLDTNELIVGDTCYYQSNVAEVGYLVRSSFTSGTDDGVELVSAKSALINVKDEYAGADKINAAMGERMDWLTEQAKDSIADAQSDYDYAMEYASENDMEPFFAPYSYTETVNDIEYKKDNILCFNISGYEFFGGVHGMPYMETYIFDLDTGDRLSIKDFITIPEEELKDVVTAAINKKIQAEGPDMYWEDAESTVRERVSYDYTSAYLTEDGIVFFFEPYLLASYAQGFVDVKIPYEVLTKEDDEK